MRTLLLAFRTRAGMTRVKHEPAGYVAIRYEPRAPALYSQHASARRDFETIRGPGRLVDVRRVPSTWPTVLKARGVMGFGARMFFLALVSSASARSAPLVSRVLQERISGYR